MSYSYEPRTRTSIAISRVIKLVRALIHSNAFTPTRTGREQVRVRVQVACRRAAWRLQRYRTGTLRSYFYSYSYSSSNNENENEYRYRTSSLNS
eukprot:scaffold404684_cov33-Prasinocladus_malaysianus.AAC.1